MPANLTPEYLEAERKYRQAQTIEEKIEALKLMLSRIPKHKGTEKLQADIKSKLAKLKKQASSKKHSSRKKPLYHIPREGAGRVVIIGDVNTGKSKLFMALTGVDAEVGDYPFTTRSPSVGMMSYEDVSIQIIDLPPISETYMESWVVQLIRLSDVAMLVFDVSSLDPVSQIERPIKTLADRKVELVGGKDNDSGSAQSSVARIKTICVANFMDVEGSAEMLGLIVSETEFKFDFVGVSALGESGIDRLKGEVFSALDVIRIYSKQPGKKIDPEPFVLKRNSKVVDFAGKVHRDFIEKLKFARLWRNSGKLEGIKVSKDFILADGDIIELHI